jgi:hypothetical protein
MANPKSIRSRKRRKAVPYESVVRFPEVKGKTIELAEINVSADYYTIEIHFKDKTLLSFDIEPCLTVMPGLLGQRRGDLEPLKKWPAVNSRTSTIWP